jgi:hypothetical protein
MVAEPTNAYTYEDVDRAEKLATEARLLAEANRRVGRYEIANAQYESFLHQSRRADAIRDTLDPGWRDELETDSPGYSPPDPRAADGAEATGHAWRQRAAEARGRGETSYADVLDGLAGQAADRAASTRAAIPLHDEALRRLTEAQRHELSELGPDAHADTIGDYQLAHTAARASAGDYATARQMERDLFSRYDLDATLPPEAEGDSGIAAGDEQLSQFLRTHPGLRGYDSGHFNSYYARQEQMPPRHAEPIQQDQRAETLTWIRGYAPDQTWGLTDEQALRFAQETQADHRYWTRVQETGSPEEQAAAAATLYTSVLRPGDALTEEYVRETYAPDVVAEMAPAEAVQWYRGVQVETYPVPDLELDRWAARHSLALTNAERAAGGGNTPEALRWAGLAREADWELTGEADEDRWAAQIAADQHDRAEAATAFSREALQQGITEQLHVAFAPRPELSTAGTKLEEADASHDLSRPITERRARDLAQAFDRLGIEPMPSIEDLKGMTEPERQAAVAASSVSADQYEELPGWYRTQLRERAEQTIARREASQEADRHSGLQTQTQAETDTGSEAHESEAASSGTRRDAQPAPQEHPVDVADAKMDRPERAAETPVQTRPEHARAEMTGGDPPEAAAAPEPTTAAHQHLADAHAALGRVSAARAEVATRDGESTDAYLTRGREVGPGGQPGRSQDPVELSHAWSSTLGSGSGSGGRAEPTSGPTASGSHL